MFILRKKILLASNSPRRKELLKELGFPFEVVQAETDEHYHQGMAPESVSAYLARKKAGAFEGYAEEVLILCADTIVILKGEVLGKPVDREEAVRMLGMLSGATHQVFTSVCIKDGSRYYLETDKADVTFRELSEQEISYYVDTFQPFDKAGAYGIQEWLGMAAVANISGSFYTIMGLPTHLVYKMLQPFIRSA